MCGSTFSDKNELNEHYKTHPTNNNFTLYKSAFKKNLKIMVKNLQIQSSGKTIYFNFTEFFFDDG